MKHIRVCSICFADEDGQMQRLIDRYEADGLVTVEYVECLEICEPEPVIAVDDIIVAPATTPKIKQLVETVSNG